MRRAISSRVRNCASIPFRRIALPRRIAASMSAGECTRFSTPRALYITLKFSSCDRRFPELERKLVEMRVRIEVVVGAHDGRVAARVAAADPSLLEHGDVADSVLLRQVIRGGEAVPATADDHDVVASPGLRAAPRPRPVPVAADRIADETRNRIACHASTGVKGPATGTRASGPLSGGRTARPAARTRRSCHRR